MLPGHGVDLAEEFRNELSKKLSVYLCESYGEPRYKPQIGCVNSPTTLAPTTLWEAKARRNHVTAICIVYPLLCLVYHHPPMAGLAFFT